MSLAFLIAKYAHRPSLSRPGCSAAATEIAQPSIVRDSIAALRQLRELGIEADPAIVTASSLSQGHSMRYQRTRSIQP
jgi:hypothetical protein